jgi:signal transduction histidine kinase
LIRVPRLPPRVGGAVVVVTAIAVDLLLWGGARHLRFGGELPIWLIPLTTVGVLLTLVWRAEHPVEVFAAQCLYGLIGLLIDGYGPQAGLIVALYALAARRPLRTAAPALVAALVPAVLDAAAEATHRAHVETPFLASFTAIFALYAVVVVAAWSMGRLTFRAERRSATLLARREADGAAALVAERRRLARELHDIVAHSVTSMMLQTSTAAVLVGDRDDRAGALLRGVQELGLAAMHELHRLLDVLRVDDVPPVSPPDRAHAIDDLELLLRTARASGLDVRLVSHGARRPLDPGRELAVYRVVQEALTNALKHAGAARTTVSLAWASDLTVRIRSAGAFNGPGAISGAVSGSGDPTAPSRPVRPELSSGNGLVGLAERVALAGGRFSSGPRGADFLVTAVFHLDQPATRIRQLI